MGQVDSSAELLGLMRLNDVHQSAAGGIDSSQVSFLSQLEAQFREL